MMMKVCWCGEDLFTTNKDRLMNCSLQVSSKRKRVPRVNLTKKRV